MEKREKFTKYQIAILILILALTAIAWIYIARSGSGDGGMVMDMGTADAEMEAAMEERLLSAATRIVAPDFRMFVPMWVAMCIAMMLPTAIPMILVVQRVGEQKKSGREAVWFFVLAYVLIWLAFGLVIWAAAAGIFYLAGAWLSASRNLWMILGILFLACGIYQLSPLKNACLTGCQHPMSFILRHWRDGNTGAFRMGLLHGLFCLGCCVALMVVMFPLGMMNLVWMGLFTLLMFFEKNARFGGLLSKIAGWILVAAGGVLIVAAIAFYAMGTT